MYNKNDGLTLYYVLTLIAIAKEMMAMGYVRPGQKQVKQDVCLAMPSSGLTFTTLLLSTINILAVMVGYVVFTYNNVDLKSASFVSWSSRRRCRDCTLHVQNHGSPEAYTYIIDIGGYTTDVMKFSRGGQVDMAFCESFNNGVIKMYDEVRRAVRNRFQLDVDDYTIDNILRCGYNPGKELNDGFTRPPVNYARTLIRSLKEKALT